VTVEVGTDIHQAQQK